MLAFPFVVVMIVFTAILSSVVTSLLPYMPNAWHAVKTRIKRVFTRKQSIDEHNLDVIVDSINVLHKEVNNIAERLTIREKHLKGNIRRYVREYLEELKK